MMPKKNISRYLLALFFLSLGCIAQACPKDERELLFLTGHQITQLSRVQIKVLKHCLSDEGFSIIYSRLSERQSQEFILGLSPEDIGNLSIEEIRKIDPGTLKKLSGKQFDAINQNKISRLTESQIQALTNNQLYIAYKMLIGREGLEEFIALLKEGQILGLIKNLPAKEYSIVFNAANPDALGRLIGALDTQSKELLLSLTQESKIAQVYLRLPDGSN